MTAEITTAFDVDGREYAEAMYANQPAWHGLGHVFDPTGNSAPTSEDAMRLAHLDWTVEKRQMAFKNDHGLAIPTDFYGLVRTDTDNCFGIVSDRYAVWQNHEAFSFLDSLQQDGVLRYEAAMSLYGGKRVCLLARLPSIDFGQPDAKGNGWSRDPLFRYILCTTTHDGSGSIQMLPTSVRVVCANTLAIALGDKDNTIALKHSGELSERLDQARSYLAMFDQQFTQYAESVHVLADKGISREQAVKYIDELFPIADDLTDRQKNSIEDKKAACRKGYKHESNMNLGQTWWRMLNAVTFAVDHDEKFNRFKGKTEVRKERRFISQLEDKGAKLKSKALKLAIDMSA